MPGAPKPEALEKSVEGFLQKLLVTKGIATRSFLAPSSDALCSY